MSDAGPYANCRLAVARRIPCERQPRIDILVVVRHSRFSVESRIAWIRETRRAIADDGAPLVCVETLQAETVHIAVFELHGEERLPPDAVCHRQFRRELPDILTIETEKILIDIDRIRIRLTELGHVA